MGFTGLDFIFDNQYSENYGLKIMSINGSLTTNASAGCGIEVFADWVYRNPSAHHQGVAQNEPLEFELELVSEDELPGIMRSKISKWLFGRMNFCKLQIVQRDLQDIYFNCHLIDPQLTYIGNHCHGITCKVQCDAPWAWQNEKTYKFNSNAANQITDESGTYFTWRHYNDSDDTDYTYPIIKFKMKRGGDFSIINTSDNNREFKFGITENGTAKTLVENEELIVDCRNQTLETSYTGRNTLSEIFNKKFLRLVSGVNDLRITGDFESIEMKYRNARKVGG